MPDKELPEFKTERLFLRGICLSDAKSYEKHFVDYEIIQYLKMVPWPYSKGGVEDYFKNVMFPNQGIDQWHWGIFLKEKQKECIGSIGLFQKDSGGGNRGFWLAKKYHGKGLMTEAVQPVLNYAFKKLDFNKLIFENAVQNKASRRIKEKTGCRYVKTVPRKAINPKYKESEVWELKKIDWLKFCNGKNKEN